MLVSFNPAISRSRVSNQNKNLNRAQNPNFKGSGFTPELLSKGSSALEYFLQGIKYGIVPKNEETINTMRKTLNIVKARKGNNSFEEQILNPIIKEWDKNGRFPADF